jgi:four helix bundle protein
MANKYTFRDLVVWQKAIRLSTTVYEMTRLLPEDERYGLKSQLRRAAVSVASNIAEGNARDTRRDFMKFLAIARGSLAELETQFIIAAELRLLSELKTVMDDIQEVRRLLQGLIRSLRRAEQTNG